VCRREQHDHDLRRNDDDRHRSAVADLQKVMTRLGYYSGPIDGVYGPATTTAVKAMQQALGVTADGVYGPSTSAALTSKGKDAVV
jgi:peptidoglycan hydrolase-like protein with peptidoglycan-binding domain